MTRLVSVLVVAGALTLAGCSAMEQYHYAPAFSEVPTPVKLAFSDKYPNDTIQMNQTVAQKMFDGTLRYRLVVLNTKNVERQVVFTADGAEVK